LYVDERPNAGGGAGAAAKEAAKEAEGVAEVARASAGERVRGAALGVGER
jgi:hypothetical protein